MTTTLEDTMIVTASGNLPGGDTMFLHAKFEEDFGQREAEFSASDVMELMAEQGVDQPAKLRVTLDWWRSRAIEPAPPSAGRYVYVISCLNTPEPILKIGIAASPEKRVKQLSTSSPHPLRLEFTRYFEAAQAIESLAHQHFEERRQNGEWFSVPVDDAIAFLSQDAR